MAKCEHCSTNNQQHTLNLQLRNLIHFVIFNSYYFQAVNLHFRQQLFYYFIILYGTKKMALQYGLQSHYRILFIHNK